MNAETFEKSLELLGDLNAYRRYVAAGQQDSAQDTMLVLLEKNIERARAGLLPLMP